MDPTVTMNIRLVIAWHSGDSFQASILADDTGRAWAKLYRTKLDCATELSEIGLLTIMDQDDLLAVEFDWKAKVLTGVSTVDAEILAFAGFLETTPVILN